MKSNAGDLMTTHGERTARTAEWNATSYHEVSQPHMAWGATVLDRLPLQGDETVLDAGCGTGKLTMELLERLPRGRVIAFDRSANMLAIAEEELSRRFPGQARVLQGDLQVIDALMLGETVDAVFSTATFHWVLDHDRLMTGLYDTLRPGGWLVAQCGGGPNLLRLRERAQALMAAPPLSDHFQGWGGPWHFSSEEEMTTCLERAGFVEIATGLEPRPTVLPDAATFREFLTTVVFGEHLSRLPSDELRSRLIEPLVEVAAADLTPFELDYWRLNLSAHRPNG